MRIGAFEIQEQLPEMSNTLALATLSPWIDVGRVGSLALGFLENRFKSVEIGKLYRPGIFYDFTRYRPITSLVDGQRTFIIPNTHINYLNIPDFGELAFFHCLEPNAMGEYYVESVLKALARLNVSKYCLVGAMYDAVPHTRPLVVTGSASNPAMTEKLVRAGVRSSQYQGPTSINTLITHRAGELGIETLTLLVHLPNYLQLNEDYSGHYTVLNLLNYFYGLPVELAQPKQLGESQYARISLAMENNPQAVELIKALETSYDEGDQKPGEPVPHLSPEVEKFLNEIEHRLDSEQ